MVDTVSVYGEYSTLCSCLINAYVSASGQKFTILVIVFILVTIRLQNPRPIKNPDAFKNCATGPCITLRSGSNIKTGSHTLAGNHVTGIRHAAASSPS